MKCEICDREFEKINGFGTHLKIKHNISKEDYYLKYIGSKGICPVCGKETKFENLIKGYRKYCSYKCSANSKETRKKFKQTCLKKYGVKNPLKNKKVQDKIRKTNLKKYGVENPQQNIEIKEKTKQTCLEKYGYCYIFQSEEIKEKSKQTCLKKYGVENPNKYEKFKEKRKNTCLEKYGVEHPSKYKEIKEKRKSTCLKRYGVLYVSQNNDTRIKIKKTCLKRYGVEHNLLVEKFKEKRRQTFLNKYGKDNPFKNKKIIEKMKKNNRTKFYNDFFNSDRLKGKCIPLFSLEDYKGVHLKYKWKCNKCNTIFKDHLNDGRVPRCPVCYPNIFLSSIFEKEISSFCKQFFPDLLENDRIVLDGLELDIYIPSINLAIECNGLYWHSELNGKYKKYHLNKTLECYKKDIKLIHIFEDEWTSNKNRIKKILLKEMNIIPRETNFKDKMIVDRRFSDGKYLLENGYKLIETINPQQYIPKNYKNVSLIENHSFKVWDCGKLIFKKVV